MCINNSEVLLGKEINEANEFFKTKFEKYTLGDNQYLSEKNESEKIFGSLYERILINITNNKIEGITFYVLNRIDQKSIDLFIKKHGDPDNVQVIDKIKYFDDQEIKGEFPQILKRTEFTTRKGNLN